jgi:hypothetical protein
MISYNFDGSKMVKRIENTIRQLDRDRTKAFLNVVGVVVQREIRLECPVASADLKNSIIPKVVVNSSEKSVSIWGFKYWRWVENGRPPGKMPPVKAIMRWAKYKGLPNPKKIAWAIAVHIKNFGTKANPFVKRGSTRARLILRQDENLFMKDIAGVKA